jgi:hypothetical protein
MKIILQNCYADNYLSLGNLTWHKNKVAYAAKHGYGTRLNIYQNEADTPHPLSFYGFKKIYHLQKIFNEDNPDWVWVTGCDSLITNFNIKLESIIDENFHFIIAKDVNGINMDSFLVRNSQEGRSFIDLIASSYEKYKDHPLAEQGCVIDNLVEFNNIIKIVHQKTFNSYNYEIMYNQGIIHHPPPWEGMWEHGDLLIHWPAMQLYRRLQLAEEYSQHVIL